MAIVDDGDLIRGLGYIALYAAYVEEAIDLCINCFETHEINFDEKVKRQPTSQKIKFINDKLENMMPLSHELERFRNALAFTDDLLEKRNIVLHSRIYAVPGIGDIRKPGRPNLPEVPASSSECYDLANDIFSTLPLLKNAAMFALPRHMSTYVTR